LFQAAACINVRRIFAGIAQLVEQLICNQQVVGSNPTAGSFPVRIADLLTCFLVDAQAHARDNKPKKLPAPRPT
jgi:hypothetical protein